MSNWSTVFNVGLYSIEEDLLKVSFRILLIETVYHSFVPNKLFNVTSVPIISAVFVVSHFNDVHLLKSIQITMQV